MRAEIATLEAKARARTAIRDRLERDALRLLGLGFTPTHLSAPQREAVEELRTIHEELLAAQARLAERTATFARLRSSVGAKQTQLARLRDRAQTLAAAAAKGDTEAREAQLAILRSLARDATAAQAEVARLVATAMVEGDPASDWRLPVRGPITQAFGPSALEYSPALDYGRVRYAHFHDAIDIAAPLGTPVVAAAAGRVVFVGHLADGAMIVLVAHPGGFVSQYAHLDDTFAPPPIAAGQSVVAGEVLGYVGLTGMTTGPHLHFAITRQGQPIDPLSLIAASRP